MKKLVILALFLILGLTGGWFGVIFYKNNQAKIEAAKIKPLEKYEFENLMKAEIPVSAIEVGNLLKDNGEFKSFEFSFKVDNKKVTGLINLPQKEGTFPLIIMFRGYVDQQEYVIGEGTRNIGEVFAQNGYITLAPDFLGYGNSDGESADIFESRFQTYTTVLTLIKSVESISQWNKKDIFIWGHSNGGQIALTVLELTGADYPTVLWAPVSKPFPYSVLYYTDESDDHGKFIREKLAEFEKTYDVEKYSLTNYLNLIKAPLQLNQGTADDAVPYLWSDNLAKILKGNGAEIQYFKYPGADHNLVPAWNLAVQRSLDFFKKNLKK
jgi:dipeptidyl aminopeptidase/acylaminoacyl peptidase